MREHCEAKQVGASVVCERCCVHWDVNDPHPPDCLTDEQVKVLLRSRSQGPEPIYVGITLAMIEKEIGGELPKDAQLDASEFGLMVTLPDGRVFEFTGYEEGKWPE